MEGRRVRVASRQSRLALTQTNWVISQLQARHPEWSFEVIPVVTKGDRVLSVSLDKVGGKGLFVTEVEQTLQNRTADFAVHSLKDMPAQVADGLVVAGMPKREDPRDAWISRDGIGIGQMESGKVVGTSSLRRMAQLKALRGDLEFQTLRGNIDTRLRRVQEGAFDAIILAAAGLHRMGWADRIVDYIPTEDCLPAVGQGVLGIECRADDDTLIEALTNLTDGDTRLCALAERSMLQALQAGCQYPVAGHAVIESSKITLRGLVAAEDGSSIIRAEHTGTNPFDVGESVAQALLSDGAAGLLKEP